MPHLNGERATPEGLYDYGRRVKGIPRKRGCRRGRYDRIRKSLQQPPATLANISGTTSGTLHA
jgi:hypothetical protein